MAVRETMRANAAAVVQPGEKIQVVFGAQTTSVWWAVVSVWIIVLQAPYRVVVVTDRRILVCRSGRFRTTAVNDVLGEFARSTRLGPATGLWYKCTALGAPLYIAKRFHKDIEQADAKLGAI